MRVHFTFRNVEPSEALKAYARDKIAKMQRYVRAPLQAQVELYTERHLHCVELAVRAEGDRFAARVDSEDMYASIDLVLDKVDRQLREAKDAANHRKRQAGGVSQLSGKHGPLPQPLDPVPQPPDEG